MILPRIIPSLLLEGSGLYKTRKFKNPSYIGDPINALKIFNDKQVDEIAVLDIGLAKSRKEPNFDLLKNMASECFMPLSYGGGITSIEEIRELISLGIEKIVINTSAYSNPELIRKSSSIFGVSTIVGSIDVKKNWLGKKKVVINGGEEEIPVSPQDWARELESMGCGEIILNSVDRDSGMKGYDLDLIEKVSACISIPLVASGGANNLSSCYQAIKAGASASMAGSMFVYKGKHRGVLITYPKYSEIKEIFANLQES